MQKLVAMFAALCSMGTLTLAQNVKPRVIPLHSEIEDGEALVIPAASPVRLVSLGQDPDNYVTFDGRFTLSGSYALEVNEDELTLIMWPDKKSRIALPYWRERGGPKEIYISNEQAFAEAVLPKYKLQKLKAQDLATVRGQVTIVADNYYTYIQCDVGNFKARFVSIVKVVKIAGKPRSEQDC